MKPIRSFIGFNIPPPVLNHIRRIQDALSSEGVSMRWTPAGNVHLTLKFLGNIAPADVDRIADVMAEAASGAPAMQLRVKGIGVFPNIRRPRVLWVGLAGDTAALVHLQMRLDTGLENLGFAREARRFKAHLTIGRTRGSIDPRRLVSAMEGAGKNASDPFAADRLILLQSELFPAGPVYTELRTAPLGG